MIGRFKNIDKYGRNVYLPEHIKKIEIDTSNIDSFMEKIQDFSEQDQMWLIKRLVVEIEDGQMEYNKELDVSMKFYLDTMKNIEVLEKRNPNSIKIKEMKQYTEKSINRVKEAMKDEL